MNKIEIDSDTENRLTAVEGKGVGDLVKKEKRLRKKLIDTDNSMVITRRKESGAGRRVEKGDK